MSLEQQMPFERFVLPLGTPAAVLELVGGKGASLARLTLAGLPVPPGFYITTEAYRHYVATNNLQEAIVAAVTSVNPNDPAALEEASARIKACFAGGTLPENIAKAICQAYTQLGGGKLAVAVRSSATAEDLPGKSFAGQYETYLNIKGEDKVLNAVKRCWASLWTARAIGYRAHQGITNEQVSLAVVVQQLIPADAAGVLFTANPLTGERDQIMLNATWGLGEAIVSGLVTPDTFVVDKTSGNIITQQIADKEVMIVCTPDGTQEKLVPTRQRTKAVLTAAQVTVLQRIGMQIEQFYDQPMDIEWVMRDKQFFIVQARPITMLLNKTNNAGITPGSTWQLPRSGGHYIRNSVTELLPDPLSPLFATMGLPAWNKAMHAILRKMGLGHIATHDLLITINGYAYYDMTLTRAQTARLALMLPRVVAFVSRLQRTPQQQWKQTARPMYASIVERWEGANLCAMSATHLLSGVREILSGAAEYYVSIQCGILLAAYRTEGVFTAVYERIFRQHGDPPTQTFLLGYESSAIQAEKSLYDLTQWIHTRQGLVDILKNIKREQFLAAYQTAQEIDVDSEVWSEFQQRFAVYLASFGHGIYDLDFAKPTLADDPILLLDILKLFLSREVLDTYMRQAALVAKREQAVQTFLTRLRGLRLLLFRSLLDKAQLFVPLREDALMDVGLGWPILRYIFHEIGSRIVKVGGISSADSVFWLTADEVQAATLALDRKQPIANYQSEVRERFDLWERSRQMTPPVALPLQRHTRFLGTDLSRWLPAHTNQERDWEIKGIGVSPGRVTGRVRVIHGPDEFNQVQSGDILVARITTPAWTPLFALVAGVVTDVGGPLSHSSIVAREYNIPAVLGTGIATERLHSAQYVTVDGDAGTVTIADL